MNWDGIGAISEIVGAVGVIATLAYLATQIRQNTNQLKGEAVISINDAEFDLDSELRSNPDLFSALIRGMSDWNSLTPKEQASTHLFFHSHTRWCETCFTLWSRGTLDEETYYSRERFLLSFLGNPSGGRIWWAHWKIIFDPRFVVRIDQKFSDTANSESVIQTAPFYEIRHWQE